MIISSTHSLVGITIASVHHIGIDSKSRMTKTSGTGSWISPPRSIGTRTWRIDVLRATVCEWSWRIDVWISLSFRPSMHSPVIWNQNRRSDSVIRWSCSIILRCRLCYPLSFRSLFDRPLPQVLCPYYRQPHSNRTWRDSLKFQCEFSGRKNASALNWNKCSIWLHVQSQIQ